MAKQARPASRTQKGETLAEVLVALLIVALATLLLVSMTMVSGTIDMAALEKDKAFYAALTRVEALDGTAKVSDPATMHSALIREAELTTGEPRPDGSAQSVEVQVYTADGLTLYKGVG